ncbi:MAG: FHA domain-containing protein, partial [Planctomycetia bacterium]|nr:FHA domain-containing protein [Planctomycetia bacterium]
MQGPDHGRRFVLPDDDVYIGRAPTNDLRLKDMEASRRHAKIKRVDNERFLVDLNSSNGVYVNGKRVKSHRLANGERIQIGKTVILFASRTVDVGAQAPLVDILKEPEPDSQILHSLDLDGSERQLNQKSLTDQSPEWIQKAKERLNFIYHATLATSENIDVDQLLKRILELLFQCVPADRGCVFLYDNENKKLIPKASINKKSGVRVRISQTILNHVIETQKAVLTSNAPNDKRWNNANSVLTAGVKEAICVPMLGRYGLIGVVYLDVSRPFVEQVKSDLVMENIAQNQENQSDGNPAQINNIPQPPCATASQDSKDLQSNDLEPLLTSSHDRVQDDSDQDSANYSFFLRDLLEDSPNQSTNKQKQLTIDHLKLIVAVACQAALAVEDAQFYLGLAQAERLAAIGQTVVVLSHHIKNILQGIRGGSFLIQTGLNAHDESLVSKGWSIVEKNQTKISDLVLDMLTFSKERVPVWSLENFNALMNDIIELMRGRALDLDVALELQQPDAIVPFYFDKEQIHRAVVNLIGNAIEAVKNRVESQKTEQDDLGNNANAPYLERPVIAPGLVRVTVTSKPEQERVVLYVDDNGAGVPMQIREDLFKPFASVNKSGGTGLGLAVTQKIVQEHHGRIYLDDSPLG